jgi:hypothetical protein
MTNSELQLSSDNAVDTNETFNVNFGHEFSVWAHVMMQFVLSICMLWMTTIKIVLVPLDGIVML